MSGPGSEIARHPHHLTTPADCMAAHRPHNRHKKPQCLSGSEGSLKLCVRMAPNFSRNLLLLLLMPTWQASDAKDQHQGGGEDRHKCHLAGVHPRITWKDATSEDTTMDSARESMTRGNSMATTKGGTRTSGTAMKTAMKTMRTRDRAGQQFDEDGTIVNHRIRVLETLKTPAPVDHQSWNGLKTVRMETMTNGDESGSTRRSRSSKKNWQSSDNRITRQMNPSPPTDKQDK